MGYCSLRVVSPPIGQLVSTNEAALHLRIDAGTDEVGYYVAAATSWAESYLNRALLTRTLQFTISPSRPAVANPGVNPIIFVTPMSWWPVSGAPIELPMSPVQSVTQVVQRAPDGTSTTLSATTDFYANVTSDPARITLRGIGQPLGSDLAVTYVAGYGGTSEAVPHTIKQAIRLLTGFFYEHRGDDDAGEPPSAVKMLLNSERMVTFA